VRCSSVVHRLNCSGSRRRTRPSRPATGAAENLYFRSAKDDQKCRWPPAVDSHVDLVTCSAAKYWSSDDAVDVPAPVESELPKIHAD
jgi:hypothetical protein